MGNVHVTDIDASIWVSASAGAGKTKNLIDRILSLLVNGVQPSKILCLTYTKNAASEMYERLNKFVNRWENSDDASIKSDLQNIGIDSILYKNAKILANVSRTQQWVRIQTIHSFCQELLATFPIEAGVMPNSVVIEDFEKKALIEKAYIKTLSNEGLHEDISFLCYYKGDILSLIEENLQLLGNFLENYSAQDLKELYGKFFTCTYSSEDEILKNFCTQKSKEIANHVADFFDSEVHRNSLKKFPNFDVREIFLKADGERRSRVLKADIIKKNNLQEEVNFLSELVYEINDHRNRLLVAKINRGFIKIASEAIRQYEKIKRQNNMIDFDDIVSKGKNLLLHHKHALDFVDSMLDHILVDEAQDTSAKQWEIIELITSKFFTNSQHKRTIFVVGDKKQSIYSFQGADYELFFKMYGFFKEKTLKSGQRWGDVELNKSYRSGPVIINFVNRVFANIFPDDVHLAARTSSKSKVVINPIYDLSDNENDDDKDEISKNEGKMISLRKHAQDIAKYIKDTINSKVFLPSRQRSAEPKDFMILSQRRSDLQLMVAEELSKLGIPCSGSDKISVNEDLIIEDILALAKFCLTPYDDLNFAIVLKGPIFNLTEDELFDLCVNRKDKTLWEYMLEIQQETGKYTSFVNKLNEYIKYAYLTPIEFFMKIAETGDVDILTKRLGGTSKESFNFLLEKCTTFSGAQFLGEFIDWFKNGNFSIKKNKTIDTNEVSMMTVHGSKGLQAPIVIIIDAAFVNRNYSPIVPCGQNFIFLDHLDFANQISKKYIEEVKRKEFEESKRLLYVAITRAEDCLNIYAHKSQKNIPTASWYSLIGGKELTEGEEFDTVDKSLTVEKTYTPWPVFKPLSPLKQKNNLKNEHEVYGDFVHYLLEKLPTLPESDWRFFAEQTKINLPDDVKNDAINETIDLLNNEKVKELLKKSVASELEICYDGKVKRVDAICDVDGELFVIDFKTGTEDHHNVAYEKQLGEYRKMLQSVFPNKRIRTFILWTKTQVLFEIGCLRRKRNDVRQVDFGW